MEQLSYYKKGDRVLVFQKYHTEEDFEGSAVMEQFLGIDEADNAELWLVRFEGDSDLVQRRFDRARDPRSISLVMTGEMISDTLRADEIGRKMDEETVIMNSGKVESKLEFSSLNYGLIEGNLGVVITTHDCVHQVYSFAEHGFDPEVEFPVWRREREPNGAARLDIFPFMRIKIKLSELRRYAFQEPVNARDWVHYFGIKVRVACNYALLRSSVKEIDSKVVLPDWRAPLREEVRNWSTNYRADEDD